MNRANYWLDLFTGTTWKEFLTAGGKVSGFRESRWNTVQKIKPGDFLICYLTGVSRFIGILEVTSMPYKDHEPIWSIADFPCRIQVKIIISLEPETAVPIHDLREKLSIFENLKSPNAWTGKLRGSPAKWKSSDGEVIYQALIAAKEDPVKRPVDPRKLARKPPAIKSKIGIVTVPESDEDDIVDIHKPLPETKISEHTEIQYLLLKLGNDMGFDVWVARNDQNREIRGKKFSEYFSLLTELPLQFDEATTKTIEFIDVLWLKGKAIVAAFEVESTTSIYSGLLRMSDLIAMQPNINIPLYLVAPDERREKVFVEVNRPTFSRLSPPLYNHCKFISFSNLKQQLEIVAPYVKYLKPSFLDDLSETCDVEEI